ncbi:cleft lip and palate transmembrane protein 1-domain-containing protein [Pelagophyceae sp. CCMP2097]|nr:cleft lip and palate transmembrane protein 1-domain-containing protein [Pelagophyceae sp. CCMP2097]
MFDGSTVSQEPRAKSELEKWAEKYSPAKEGPEAPFFPTHDAAGAKFPPHKLKWPDGAALELHAYVSLDEAFDFNSSQHLWSETGLGYDFHPSNTRAVSFDFDSQSPVVGGAWRNETVFAHVFIALANETFDIRDYDASRVVEAHCELTSHRKPKKVANKKSLLGEAAKEDEPAADGNATLEDAVVFWKPTLRIRLVAMHTEFQRAGIPAAIATILRFDADGDYYPVVYIDEFWLTTKQLYAVNSTLTSTALSASYGTIGFVKWQLQHSLSEQWRSQAKLGLQSEGESDIIREMLAETQPWLLALTAIISVLHMVFEGLAFRNNVKFWRNKKTLEGLSARTIGLNCFFQTVILLYLMDNDTSWMIMFSSGMGLLTEFFKLTKAVRIRRDPVTGRITGVHAEESYAASPTKRYDDEATTHLLYVVVPLLVGYAAFSLVTGTHKGWYSWAVGSLVGFIYVFGFVMMTPQLYINYRLKSVAHLPWRAMVYKSLNTFIDDLFAFIIKMPTLHRLSCLRDDVIFIATLYQRYIYAVDFTRVNEFGQGGDDEDEPAPELLEAKDRVPTAALPEGEGKGIESLD